MATTAVRNIKRLKQKGKIAGAIAEAVPSKEKLFNTSREIFKEIDDSGAIIKSDVFDSFVDEISSQVKRRGIHRKTTPKSYGALEELTKNKGRDISLTELDTYRNIAKNAAGSSDKPDASLGSDIVDSIDGLINDIGEGDLRTIRGVDASEIGDKYKVARDPWIVTGKQD